MNTLNSSGVTLLLFTLGYWKILFNNLTAIITVLRSWQRIGLCLKFRLQRKLLLWWHMLTWKFLELKELRMSSVQLTNQFFLLSSLLSHLSHQCSTPPPPAPWKPRG